MTCPLAQKIIFLLMVMNADSSMQTITKVLKSFKSWEEFLYVPSFFLLQCLCPIQVFTIVIFKTKSTYCFGMKL